MFAKVKRITKPIQKQDFYLPTGEPVLPDNYFPQFHRSRRLWKFKNLPIARAMELAQGGHLVFTSRIYFCQSCGIVTYRFNVSE